jgi:type I site-specific restriction endonuclease
MARNERLTCKEVIEPALSAARLVVAGAVAHRPGRVNLTGDTMYDETQSIIADYLLRYRGVPLADLEAKAEAKRCRRHAAGLALCTPTVDALLACLQRHRLDPHRQRHR